jgi:type IV pilus assembly protein PilX
MKNLPPRPSLQKGLVLIITLIVLVAMTLAAVALVRSVDTAVLATGNFAFKQQSMGAPERAIEQAIRAIVGDPDTNVTATITNLAADFLAENYYASIQAGESSPTNVVAGVPFGVPARLHTIAAYPTGFRSIVMPGTNDTARYVIERQCTAAGPATAAICNMARGGIAAPGGTTHDENVAVQDRPTYRLTVRVDGARNTVTFAQAVLR